MGDQDGLEEVEAYDCHESCPIAEIDRQSGVRKSGVMKAGQQRNASKGKGGYMGDFPDAATLQETYGDQGGASRYFTNFHYFPKASRSERNQGCEGLPEVATSYMSNANGTGETWHPIDERIGAERDRFATTKQNHHPCVKSLALMRWLIRLITPPDGIVLDCFLGSGSTAVAALQEGHHFIGIEQDSSYVAIAQARIACVQREQGMMAQCTPKQWEIDFVKGTFSDTEEVS
jgi:site-specific DNA-methyltransferase (adenine-specific)